MKATYSTRKQPALAVVSPHRTTRRRSLRDTPPTNEVPIQCAQPTKFNGQRPRAAYARPNPGPFTNPQRCHPWRITTRTTSKVAPNRNTPACRLIQCNVALHCLATVYQVCSGSTSWPMSASTHAAIITQLQSRASSCTRATWRWTQVPVLPSDMRDRPLRVSRTGSARSEPGAANDKLLCLKGTTVYWQVLPARMPRCPRTGCAPQFPATASQHLPLHAPAGARTAGIGVLLMWCGSGINRIPGKQTSRKVSLTAIPHAYGWGTPPLLSTLRCH